MAQFLDTDGISHHLIEIIKGTDTRLLLISPFLKFSDRIRERLEHQSIVLRKAVYVVYGKNELRPEESKWLENTGIRTSFREHLHAKCYMNESHALVTSMNLYEFSQQNNDEMGILVSAEEDPRVYGDIKEDAERILQMSKELEIRVTPVEGRDNDITSDKKDTPVRSKPQRESASKGRQTGIPESGFCLRCGTQIPCDPERPYCDSHYRSWARFKNESYEEKRCHTCGNDHSSSKAKPLCLSSFRKYGGALRAAG